MPILNAQHLAAASGFYEPQRSNNWSLEIPLDDVGDQLILIYSQRKIDLPSSSNSAQTINYANEARFVAGPASFGTLSLGVRDFVDIGTANAIIKWRRSVYNPETGSIGLAKNYKKNGDLIVSSPDNSISRVWKLIGLWPETDNFGSLTHDSAGFVDISVTLRYDRAIPGAGLNSNIGGINVGSLNGTF